MQTLTRKVILLEMNEVPYRIIDDFVSRHPYSNLAKLMARSKQINTVCEDQLELDPWISWPTLHRGVIDEQHRIRHLGQSLDWADRHYPPIWELLTRAGRSVGVFGSLHSSIVPADMRNYAFYVPDFFADSNFAHPSELRAFQQFNLLMTRRSARNVDGKIPVRAAITFLRQYMGHGISWSTVAKIMAVLASEHRRAHLKVRRRSLQPLIGLDVFLPLVYRAKPDFATFYTNHVAANMHRFWAAAFPDDVVESAMPAQWQRQYASEIEFSMKILDDMFERLRVLADTSDYLLLATGSIGQAAVPATTTPGFVTITNLDRFMASMGLTKDDWKRKYTMVPCISVVVDPFKAGVFEEQLKSLAVGKDRMRKEQRESAPLSYDRTADGSFQLFVYFEGRNSEKFTANVAGRETEVTQLGLGFFHHDEKVACSGRHTPFGALIIYDPRHAAHAQERSTISSLQVAPALLYNFGIPAPRYMAAFDPHLLDVTRPSSGMSVKFRGGGVETPVTRLAEEAVPLAGEKGIVLEGARRFLPCVK